MNPRTKSKINVAVATLADVLAAVEQREGQLPTTRWRDLRSAVIRVASLLGDEPAGILLDLPAISAKLSHVNAVAVGLSPKSLANIRANFLAAVKVSGLKSIGPSRKAPLNPKWTALMAQLSERRAHIGLSRMAHYASAQGVAPEDIDDAAIESFINAVREGSLHRKPQVLHRQVTLIWNEAARSPELGLQQVTVPSFRGPPENVDWSVLPAAFRQDVDAYLAWCGGSDPFAADARVRTLAPRTLRLIRSQIHAAVSALVDSGVKPSSVETLADLVTPASLKAILRRRLEKVGGAENMFNHDLGKALVQIARSWVKCGPDVVAELTRLVGRMPVPTAGLTDKNKRFLRQFDDPAILRRLLGLPDRLWAEVKRDNKPSFRTLAKAQAALAVAILCYIPLRLQNLASLEFDKHLFVQPGANAISTLELSAAEVKNKTEMAFDIPMPVVRMMIEYRERIAPKIMGQRPTRLFANPDGTPKSLATAAWLIASYSKRRAGIVLTPHQFRHLSAKVMLDAQPGAFEVVKQLLGHRNLKTTVGAYAGIDGRRAARHHQRLIEEALAAKPTTDHRSRKRTQKKA